MNYEEAEAFKKSPELQNDPGTINEQQLPSFLDKEHINDKLEIGLLRHRIEELERDNRNLTYSLAACFVEGALYYHQNHTTHDECGDPLKSWYHIRMNVEPEACKRYPMDFMPIPFPEIL